MKIVKIAAIVMLVYVGIVVAFESLIGYFQPAGASTMVITTTGADGEAADRVVARLESDGKLYVAANHWPRAWYREALANPVVEVDLGDGRHSYTAVPLEGAEYDRVNAAHPLGPVVRFLTGYPPRRLMRLDPA
ncbi:MAG: nitroreductase/quinone reductase family protein [Pseudomonadales bacterium]